MKLSGHCSGDRFVFLTTISEVRIGKSVADSGGWGGLFLVCSIAIYPQLKPDTKDKNQETYQREVLRSRDIGPSNRDIGFILDPIKR